MYETIFKRVKFRIFISFDCINAREIFSAIFYNLRNVTTPFVMFFYSSDL